MADVTRIAQKHGVSPGAVQALLDALRRGGGRQAQFSHPEWGGMGQWSAGGMTQVGDMFNTAVRDKVSWRRRSRMLPRRQARRDTTRRTGGPPGSDGHPLPARRTACAMPVSRTAGAWLSSRVAR